MSILKGLSYPFCCVNCAAFMMKRDGHGDCLAVSGKKTYREHVCDLPSLPYNIGRCGVCAAFEAEFFAGTGRCKIMRKIVDDSSRCGLWECWL